MNQAATSTRPLAGTSKALPELSESQISGVTTATAPSFRYYPEAVLRSDFRLASIYGDASSPSLSEWATEVISRVHAASVTQHEKETVSDVMYQVVARLSGASDQHVFARLVDLAAEEFGSDALTFALTALRDLGAAKAK